MQLECNPKSTVVDEGNMKRPNVKQLVLPGSQDTVYENESMRVKAQFCQGNCMCNREGQSSPCSTLKGIYGHIYKLMENYLQY